MNKKRIIIIINFFSLFFIFNCVSETNKSFLFPFEYANKYGYLNEKMEVSIAPKFLKATFFNDGYAIVKTIDNKWNIINEKEEIIIIKDEILKEISEGLIRYFDKKTKKNGFFDINGNSVFETEKYISYFSEGLARIQTENGYTFINKKWELAFKEKYFDECGYFKDGIAWVKKNNFAGFINKQGDYIIKPKFEYLSKFSEGLCYARKGNQKGFINIKGEFVIEDDIYYAISFYNGVSVICTGGIPNPVRQGEKQGTFHLIDKNGNYIIKNMEIRNINNFIDGLASFKDMQENSGYINTKGEIVIESQYTKANNFIEGYSLAYVYLHGEEGIIDLKGNVTWVKDIMAEYIPNP